MGRPLFSTSYGARTMQPEPAPTAIHFEKWTHWNPFDPDSDEFFASPDAVYEAFLDPADIQPAGEQRAEGQVPEPERLDEIIVRELAQSRSDSSASSEGTISGRGSPTAAGSDDPAGMLVDAHPAGDYETRRYGQRVADLENVRRVDDVEYHQRVREALGMPPLSYADDDVLVTTAIDLINERRVSRVMPPLSPYRSRGFIPNFPSPSIRPITPPHSHDGEQGDSHGYITYEQTSPSPAPAVTPRLYSWSSRAPLGRGDPGSPSPLQRQHSRPGPLTNPNARMSLTHISPPSVRMG